MNKYQQLLNFLRQNPKEFRNIAPKQQSRHVSILIKDWYDKLIDWIDKDDAPIPGPIDNSSLMDGDDIRSSVQYKVDFDIVEYKIGIMLFDTFTGGPQIIKKLSIPATSGASCVLINPISFEMLTKKGKKYKTCAPDWKLCDLKKFLCINIGLIPQENHFQTTNSNQKVNDNLTVGEYVKIHGNTIRLCENRNEQNPTSTSNILISTMPRQNIGCAKIHLPSISVRSGSMMGVPLPKPVGLINLGNTCFFNAAMQCIVRIKPLVEYVFSQEYDLNINKENPLGSGGVIASSFKQFLQEMSSSSIYARNPINFRRELIRKYNTFNNYSQHDSQEVVWAILDALHEDLNQSPFAKGDKTPPRYSMDEFKWKNQSFIMDLFQGYFQFSISCPSCKSSPQYLPSVTYEPFMFLSLSLPRRSYPPSTLEECFANFFKEETLDNRNLWLCPCCGKKVPAKTKTLISESPRILIIHFKRFNGSGFFATKNDTEVKYPDQFNANQISTKGFGTYHLIGAIFHSGGMMSGHYTAAAIDLQTGKWYSFNDSDARETSPKDAHSSRAYILFYEKKDL